MELGQQLLSVAFVFALLGAVVFALRRKVTWPAKTLKDRRLQSAGRIPLTPQHALHLVHYAGKELLIATHPQGCSLIVSGPEAWGRPSACAGLSARLRTPGEKGGLRGRRRPRACPPSETVIPQFIDTYFFASSFATSWGASAGVSGFGSVGLAG